jgi:hypothetical protein
MEWVLLRALPCSHGFALTASHGVSFLWGVLLPLQRTTTFLGAFWPHGW